MDEINCLNHVALFIIVANIRSTKFVEIESIRVLSFPGTRY